MTQQARNREVRNRGIDAVRGGAVISMFIAHFAPSDGPGRVLLLSEFLSAPLFALLIGVGAAAGSPRAWSTLVRGAALVGLGLWMETVPSQIAVVLVWLGVLTWLCGGLVRLPSWALVGLSGVLLALAPRLQAQFAANPARWAQVAFAHTDYRLTAFIPFACGGVLLIRHRAPRLRIGAAALLLAGGVFALDKIGVAALDPYTGTYQELGFELFLAIAVFCLGSLVLNQVTPLVALGQMALTAYVGQVLLAVLYVLRWSNDGTDNNWALLVAMITGWLGGAWLWRVLAGSVRWPRLLTGFARGPLEGVISMAAHSFRSRT